jgi:hypothetical protein
LHSPMRHADSTTGTTRLTARLRTRWAAIGAAVAVTLGAGIGVVGATSSAPSTFVAATPVRILDTRTGVGLSGPLVSAVGRDLQVTGVVPTTDGSAIVVPVGATAVSLNVTVVDPSAAGFLAVRPTGTPGAPRTSSLNFGARAVVPNAVTVALPADGRIQLIYDAYGVVGPTTQVLVDVVGYFVAGGGGGGPAGPAGPVGPAGPGLSGPLTVPRAALTLAPGPVTLSSTIWVTATQHTITLPPATCPVGTPRHQVSVVVDGTLRGEAAGADLFLSAETALAIDNPAVLVPGTLTEAAARSAGASAGARLTRVPYTTQYLFELTGSGGSRTVYVQARLGVSTSMTTTVRETRVRSVHEGYICS